MINEYIRKFLLPWLLIVISFFLASIWLDKQSLYYFDLIWRILIIGGVSFIGKIRLSFSFKQWTILALIFVLNFGSVYVYNPSHHLLYVVSAVALGPLAEEMFFRGWVISKLRGSPKDKIIKSSFLFALYHLKNAYVLAPFALIYQVLFAGLVVGPIFAWMKLRYNSLFPSLTLHSITNMVGSTVTEKLFPFIIKKNLKFSD